MRSNELENYCAAFSGYLKYQSDKKQKIDDGVNDYSLLSSLLSINDEVRLHSRFIYSLINPNGSHYCDSLFLKEFLTLIPQAEHLISLNLFDLKACQLKLKKII
jgi:hypothetical protein